MSSPVTISQGEIETPVGDAPVIPILMILFGGYLMWFGVKYWRGSGPAVWPSYPIKSVLQGKGIPPNTPAPAISGQLASFEQQVAGNIPGLTTSGSGIGSYVNPFGRSTVTPSRIDQGVDFTGSGQITALGGGTIVESIKSGSGWPSGSYSGYVSYRLADGPAAGKIVYVAEGVIPQVRSGQQITAGQTIATFAPGSSIETGWASGQGTLSESATPAGGQISGGGPFPTKLGINFDQLLVAMGVPPSPGIGSGGYGQLPPGYPNWKAQQGGGIGQGGAGGGKLLNMARMLFGRYRWDPQTQTTPLIQLWNQESGTPGAQTVTWNPKARNPNSGALGIAQALNHSTPGSGGTLGNEYGAEYGLTTQDAVAANSGSPLPQIRWGLGYIKARYGSPAAAWAHEQAQGWY